MSTRTAVRHDDFSRALRQLKVANKEPQVRFENSGTNRLAQDRLEELGIAGFLAWVEEERTRIPYGDTQLGRLQQEIRDEGAAKLVSWAHEQHELQAENDRRQSTEGRQQAESSELVREYLAWLSEEGIELSARNVFDETGEVTATPRDLRHFAELIDADSGQISRCGATEVTQAVRWHVAERRGAKPVWHLQDSSEYTPRHWALVRDEESIVPLGLSGPALGEWVADWRDNIAELRGSELCVYAEPGEPVTFVTWTEQPRGMKDVEKWCDRLSRSEDDPRFRQVEKAWSPPCTGVYLPSAYATSSRSLRDRSRKDQSSVPTVLLDLAIPSLTKQFRSRGLPASARVVIGGQTSQGKTTLALHVAEAACDQNWFVVWLAYDESRDEIQARRLQRRGVRANVARNLPEHELAKLDPLPFVVIGAGEPFEEIAEQAYGEAEDRPVLFVVDSIQKLETRAGQGKGERERITACIDSIQALQAKHPTIVVMTTEIARGSGATKGSSSIDYGATLALRVRRLAAELRVEIQKNRHGSEDPFTLALDSACQRLSDPAAAKAELAQADAHANVWGQVSAALREHGPRSRKGLELYVVAKSEVLRAVLSERVASGDLVHAEGKYRVP